MYCLSEQMPDVVDGGIQCDLDYPVLYADIFTSENDQWGNFIKTFSVLQGLSTSSYHCLAVTPDLESVCSKQEHWC